MYKKYNKWKNHIKAKLSKSKKNGIHKKVLVFSKCLCYNFTMIEIENWRSRSTLKKVYKY